MSVPSAYPGIPVTIQSLRQGEEKAKKKKKKITHKTEKAAQSQVACICRGDMKQSHSANGHTRPHNATAAKYMSG